MSSLYLKPIPVGESILSTLILAENLINVKESQILDVNMCLLNAQFNGDVTVKGNVQDVRLDDQHVLLQNGNQNLSGKFMLITPMSLEGAWCPWMKKYLIWMEGIRVRA